MDRVDIESGRRLIKVAKYYLISMMMSASSAAKGSANKRRRPRGNIEKIEYTSRLVAVARSSSVVVKTDQQLAAFRPSRAPTDRWWCYGRARYFLFQRAVCVAMSTAHTHLYALSELE